MEARRVRSPKPPLKTPLLSGADPSLSPSDLHPLPSLAQAEAGEELRRRSDRDEEHLESGAAHLVAELACAASPTAPLPRPAPQSLPVQEQ